MSKKRKRLTSEGRSGPLSKRSVVIIVITLAVIAQSVNHAAAEDVPAETAVDDNQKTEPNEKKEDDKDKQDEKKKQKEKNRKMIRETEILRKKIDSGKEVTEMELEKVLKGDNEYAKQFAVSGLVKLKGKKIVPRLIEIAKDDKSAAQIRAIYELGKLRDERALPTLAALLKHPLPIIRVNTAKAVSQIPKQAAILELIRACPV